MNKKVITTKKIFMTFSSPKNAQDYASISRKIRLFISERTFTELVKEISKNGFPLFRRLMGLSFDKKFDKKYNVDTCGSIHLKELTIDSKNVESGVIYDPAPAATLRRLFSYLPDDLKDYTLVDFGSGKGRAMFVGAEYSFGKIIGVEFANELHEVAVSNIANYKSSKQKCFEIESLCMDAVNFKIPKEKCVFYFFAPFEQNVLSQVIENIKQSYRQSPRNMVILYITDPITNPIPSDEIKNCGIFSQVRAASMPFDIAQRYPMYYEIYESR